MLCETSSPAHKDTHQEKRIYHRAFLFSIALRWWQNTSAICMHLRLCLPRAFLSCLKERCWCDGCFCQKASSTMRMIDGLIESTEANFRTSALCFVVPFYRFLLFFSFTALALDRHGNQCWSVVSFWMDAREGIRLLPSDIWRVLRRWRTHWHISPRYRVVHVDLHSPEVQLIRCEMQIIDSRYLTADCVYLYTAVLICIIC